MRRSLIKKSILAPLALLFALVSRPVLAESLDLSQGTIDISGYGVVGGTDLGDTGNFLKNMNYNLNIGLGYFVIDNLEVSAGFFVGSDSGTGLLSLGHYGGAVGVGYYFEADPVRPYVALGGWVRNDLSDKSVREPDNMLRAGIAPEVGVLVPLDEFLALQFAIRVPLHFYPSFRIDANFGLIGIMGFF